MNLAAVRGAGKSCTSETVLQRMFLRGGGSCFSKVATDNLFLRCLSNEKVPSAVFLSIFGQTIDLRSHKSETLNTKYWILNPGKRPGVWRRNVWSQQPGSVRGRSDRGCSRGNSSNICQLVSGNGSNCLYPSVRGVGFYPTTRGECISHWTQEHETICEPLWLLPEDRLTSCFLYFSRA